MNNTINTINGINTLEGFLREQNADLNSLYATKNELIRCILADEEFVDEHVIIGICADYIVNYEQWAHNHGDFLSLEVHFGDESADLTILPLRHVLGDELMDLVDRTVYRLSFKDSLYILDRNVYQNYLEDEDEWEEDIFEEYLPVEGDWLRMVRAAFGPHEEKEECFEEEDLVF